MSEALLEHIPKLRRYAGVLLRDPQGAEDLVQDTLERAMRKLHLWQPGNLRAWLFAIMHNLFVNQLKSRRIRAHVELDESIPDPSSAAPRDDVLDLDRAFEKLTPDQREALFLVAEDMTYAEMSVRLGVPIGTVMSRISRGRGRLRSFLDHDVGQSSPNTPAVTRP